MSLKDSLEKLHRKSKWNKEQNTQIDEAVDWLFGLEEDERPSIRAVCSTLQEHGVCVGRSVIEQRLREKE